MQLEQIDLLIFAEPERHLADLTVGSRPVHTLGSLLADQVDTLIRHLMLCLIDRQGMLIQL